MASTVNKNIDGLEFEFFPLPPKDAMRILVRLTKLLGEPFGILGDSAGLSAGGKEFVKNLSTGNIPEGIFGSAVRALLNRLDENEVEETIYLLLTKVYGKFEKDAGTRKLNPDVDFAGRLSLMLRVVAAALEVNFGDFLRDLFGGLTILRSDSTDTSQLETT